MSGIILLAVLGVVAYRLTTAEERAQYFTDAIDVVRELHAVATQPRADADAFRERLRARMPLLAVTPAIAAVNVAVMAGGLFWSEPPRGPPPAVPRGRRAGRPP